MSSVIIIQQDQEHHSYQLIFDRPALKLADLFLRAQVGEGGAGYAEWDFARLNEAFEDNVSFVMTYDTLGELQEAINHVSEVPALSEMLDNVMSEFRDHHPDVRPR